MTRIIHTKKWENRLTLQGKPKHGSLPKRLRVKVLVIKPNEQKN